MLAELAVADGYRIVTLDRFGDVDLRQVCPGLSLRDLGGRGGMSALAAAADDVVADAVVYGGGFENRPDLVAHLGRERRLLGNEPATLRRVRDPAILGPALSSAGIAYPQTFTAPEAPLAIDRSRRWLRKPLRGGGGRRVSGWRGGALAADEVIQERIEGIPCSIAAVGDGRSAVVLAVTEQFIGQRVFGGRGYRWCGNVVPPRIAVADSCTLLHQGRWICCSLVEQFGLRGVFGVDVVWDGRRAWVVEVNPRPTGSLEVIHLATGAATFAAHARGCENMLPPEPEAAIAHGLAAAKAVLYAEAEIVVGDTRDWYSRGIRDIPAPGEHIPTGHPVCTLTAVADTPWDAFEILCRRARRLRAELRHRIESDAVR